LKDQQFRGDSATRWGRLAAVADSMELGRSGRSIMRRRGAGRELPGHRQGAALKDQPPRDGVLKPRPHS
jgi:hypothetical protein